MAEGGSFSRSEKYMPMNVSHANCGRGTVLPSGLYADRFSLSRSRMTGWVRSMALCVPFWNASASIAASAARSGVRAGATAAAGTTSTGATGAWATGVSASASKSSGLSLSSASSPIFRGLRPI